MTTTFESMYTTFFRLLFIYLFFENVPLINRFLQKSNLYKLNNTKNCIIYILQDLSDKYIFWKHVTKLSVEDIKTLFTLLNLKFSG